MSQVRVKMQNVLGGWDGKSSHRVGGRDEGAGVDTASAEEVGVACPG